MALVAGMLLAAAAAASSGDSARSSGSRPSVDPKVVSRIATHGQATFWVVLREQANLGPAQSMRPAPRGQYVYDSLKSTADRTQAPLQGVAGSAQRALQVFLDPQLNPGDGRRLGPSWARRASGHREDRPGRRLPRTEGDPSGASVRPGHRRMGSHPSQRPSGVVDLRQPWRGHRRGRHRHGCPPHPSGARRPLPRTERQRHLQPQLQLVRPFADLRLAARAV